MGVRGSSGKQAVHVAWIDSWKPAFSIKATCRLVLVAHLFAAVIHAQYSNIDSNVVPSVQATGTPYPSAPSPHSNGSPSVTRSPVGSTPVATDSATLVSSQNSSFSAADTGSSASVNPYAPSSNTYPSAPYPAPNNSSFYLPTVAVPKNSSSTTSSTSSACVHSNGTCPEQHCFGYTPPPLATTGSGSVYASSCISQMIAYGDAITAWHQSVFINNTNIPMTSNTNIQITSSILPGANTRYDNCDVYPRVSSEKYTTWSYTSTITWTNINSASIPKRGCTLNYYSPPVSENDCRFPVSDCPNLPSDQVKWLQTKGNMLYNGCVELSTSQFQTCTVVASSVQLYYWPETTKTGAPPRCDGSNGVIYQTVAPPNGTRVATVTLSHHGAQSAGWNASAQTVVMTSPSIYLAITGVSAVKAYNYMYESGIGSVGTASIATTVMSAMPSDLSSIEQHIPGFNGPWQKELETLVAKDWSTLTVVQKPYDLRNLQRPVPPSDYFFRASNPPEPPQMLNGTSYQPSSTLEWYNYPQDTIIRDDYHPYIAVPSALRAMDPAWGDCILALNGIYDPPQPISGASFVAASPTPTPIQVAPPSAPPAAPGSSVVPPIPDVTAPVNAPAPTALNPGNAGPEPIFSAPFVPVESTKQPIQNPQNPVSTVVNNPPPPPPPPPAPQSTINDPITNPPPQTKQPVNDPPPNTIANPAPNPVSNAPVTVQPPTNIGAINQPAPPAPVNTQPPPDIGAVNLPAPPATQPANPNPVAAQPTNVPPPAPPVNGALGLGSNQQSPVIQPPNPPLAPSMNNAPQPAPAQQPNAAANAVAATQQPANAQGPAAAPVPAANAAFGLGASQQNAPVAAPAPNSPALPANNPAPAAAPAPPANAAFGLGANQQNAPVAAPAPNSPALPVANNAAAGSPNAPAVGAAQPNTAPPAPVQGALGLGSVPQNIGNQNGQSNAAAPNQPQNVNPTVPQLQGANQALGAPQQGQPAIGNPAGVGNQAPAAPPQANIQIAPGSSIAAKQAVAVQPDGAIRSDAISIGGTTILPGGAAATVQGQVISANPGGAVNVGGSVNLPLTQTPPPAQMGAVITPQSGSAPVTAVQTRDARGNPAAVIQGQTIAQGAPATLSNQIFSVNPNGNLIVQPSAGGAPSTIAMSSLPTNAQPTSPPQPSSGAVLNMGPYQPPVTAQAATAANGQRVAVVAGSTLTPGSAPLITNGATLSADTKGNVIAVQDGKTSTAAMSQLPYQPLSGPISIAPGISINPGAASTVKGADGKTTPIAILDPSHTLTYGGAPITTNGATLSADAGGNVIVAQDGQTRTVPITSAAAPNSVLSLAPGVSITGASTSSVLGSDGKTTPVAIIGDQTLAAGGRPATISGHVVSLASDGKGVVVDGTSTASIPAAAAPSGTVVSLAPGTSVTAAAVSSMIGKDGKTTPVEVVGDSTLSVGGSSAVVSGHTVSLASNGLVVDGTRTENVPTAAAAQSGGSSAGATGARGSGTSGLVKPTQVGSAKPTAANGNGSGTVKAKKERVIGCLGMALMVVVFLRRNS